MLSSGVRRSQAAVADGLDGQGYGPTAWRRSPTPSGSRTWPRPIPDRVLITCGDESITRAGLRVRGQPAGAGPARAAASSSGDMVTIALPNSIAWFVTAAACWKVGAIPQPVSYRLPAAELAGDRRAGRLAGSSSASSPDVLPGRTCLPAGHVPAPVDRRRPAAGCHLPGLEGAHLGRLDRAAEAHRRRATRRRSTRTPARRSGVDPDGCLLMPGPLYHNGPVVWSCTALLAGAPPRGAAARSTPRRRWPRSRSTPPTSCTWCPR